MSTRRAHFDVALVLGLSVGYARHRNLWPLGVSHGLLGALAYQLIGDQALVGRL